MGLARSRANLAIANTGITDPVDNDIPARHAVLRVDLPPRGARRKRRRYSRHAALAGSRNAIRNTAAEYALRRIPHYFGLLHNAASKPPSNRAEFRRADARGQTEKHDMTI